jgi:hypothetical protein
MYRINDKKMNKHWIYLDNDNTPLIIPCLYSRYTYQRGVSIELKVRKDRFSNKTNHYFEEVYIGLDAQYKRANHLGIFLDWVDKRAKFGSQISLANHTALPQEIINQYINEYLVEEMSKSEVVVDRAVTALRSYYNWLHYFFSNPYKNIFVFSSHRQKARKNNTQSLLVKYLLPATRELIYRNASCLLQEIVLRNGGELGCRTKENQGFLLNDFISNKKVHKGILNLFHDMEKSPNKVEFEYYLSSLYTKYGRARTLYIERPLLEKMKLYYDTERPKTDSNYLFVSNSNNESKGECISVGYGTVTYRQVVNDLIIKMRENPNAYLGYQALEDESVYHHLRHSFGTDVFYEICNEMKKSFESITTDSRAYIETARRLGHKIGGRYSNTTTAEYIHSCGHRERLLLDVGNHE